MLSSAGLTASPANPLGGGTPVARWFGSCPDNIPDSVLGAPALSPAPAAPVPSLQPAAASRAFSPFAWQQADDAPLDGDSADGMSPRSGAGEGEGFAALALHAAGGIVSSLLLGVPVARIASVPLSCRSVSLTCCAATESRPSVSMSSVSRISPRLHSIKPAVLSIGA